MRTVLLLAVWLAVAFAGSGAARASVPATLEVATLRKFYREHAQARIHLGVRVELPASGAEPAARNVALVLDRSGSMAGEPIEALRRSAVAALNGLAGSDIAAVVAFGSEIETVIEAQRRDRLGDPVSRIASIEPAGGAALYDALNQAAAQLRRHAGPATFNQLILVTDGPATKGPREFSDFARLAEAFAREGIAVSAIGLGSDFEEDVLAAMARASGGRFRYAATPDALADALQAELAPAFALAGSEAELTVEFHERTRKVQTHDWTPAVVAERTATYRLPRLHAGQPVNLLLSAEVDAFSARHDLPRFAAVRLRWTDAAGAQQELSRTIAVRFSSDALDLREPLVAPVARAAAHATIREGLQGAIEQLDKGDARLALRALRRSRSEAIELNYDLEDVEIARTIRQLDAYLAGWPARAPGPADRKTLRSGLLGRFDPPAPGPEPKP